MSKPRRELFNLAKRFVAENIDIDPLGLNNNLDEMYREAFERAKASGDATQMATLDFAYRREQLYFEILLDVRDAVERR